MESCFKTYDVRGVVPDELNPSIAYRIARATIQILGAKSVVVGHDIRLSGRSLAEAIFRACKEEGAISTFIGECGTEEVYFANFHLNADAGIMITASHNPAQYNGLKIVGKDCVPLSSATIEEIARRTDSIELDSDDISGVPDKEESLRQTYKSFLLSQIKSTQLSSMKVVANPGNGGAGAIIDLLRDSLPFEFIVINSEPDGTFPNGVPNPLLPENREDTGKAVVENGASFGIAWDGDFDRCFFFDEKGSYVEGYYVVSILAAFLLRQSPREAVIYEPRLMWDTVDTLTSLNGKAKISQTGHAFFKQAMRDNNAIYGGEISAHHYFRSFRYCDNGTLPWLIIGAILSETNCSLSGLIHEHRERFPCCDEQNFTIEEPLAAISKIERLYKGECKEIDRTDGLSMSFEDWRFNVRCSNTEPLVRLNLETRGNKTLLKTKLQELRSILSGFEA